MRWQIVKISDPLNRFTQRLIGHSHRMAIGMDHHVWAGHNRHMTGPEHQIAALQIGIILTGIQYFAQMSTLLWRTAYGRKRRATGR